MLIYKNENILKAYENIICHQVNVQGIMGGGLALQIAKSYPHIAKNYSQFCKENLNSYDVLKGKIYIVNINNNQEIANCFTQKPNFDTDYEAIKQVFMGLLIECKNQNKTIAVPYKYGCGIANGDWDIVSDIFEKLSKKYGVDIVIYKLEEEK